MSDIVSAEAAAQEGEALLPSAELAKNLGLTLAASVVLTFSTIVYMQGGLHSYFYAQPAPTHEASEDLADGTAARVLRGAGGAVADASETEVEGLAIRGSGTSTRRYRIDLRLGVPLPRRLWLVRDGRQVTAREHQGACEPQPRAEERGVRTAGHSHPGGRV